MKMEQKNTIVKCKTRPGCLFNHNGVCDNYVINIGADGKCESYVETATCKDCKYYEDTKLLQCKCSKDGYYKIRTAPICSDFKAKTGVVGEYRGQRAKCNVYDDACDDIVKININQPKKSKHIISDHLCDIKCISAHYAEDGELYCKLIQDFPERPSRCSAYDNGADK